MATSRRLWFFNGSTLTQLRLFRLTRIAAASNPGENRSHPRGRMRAKLLRSERCYIRKSDILFRSRKCCPLKFEAGSDGVSVEHPNRIERELVKILASEFKEFFQNVVRHSNDMNTARRGLGKHTH